MRIALDAMGGDFGPQPLVEGAVSAASDFQLHVILVGHEAQLKQELAKYSFDEKLISVVHADEVVGMDESAITPVRYKKKSSVKIAADLVKSGEASGLVSAGNTGATMVASKIVIGEIDGVDRPALATIIPTKSGKAVLLDVGANVDCKPRHLRQFAIMGNIYYQEMLGTKSPRIGLLSIGQEEEKGNELTREVYSVLKSTNLNFIGNVEGNDIFLSRVDVAVCDGFVGNIALKVAESVAEAMGSMLKEEVSKSLLGKIGFFMARGSVENFKRRVDYSEYGGAPLLGVNGSVIISHGRSSANAIRNAIKLGLELQQRKVMVRIRDEIASLAEDNKIYEEQGESEKK